MANTYEVILPPILKNLKGVKVNNTALRYENPGTMFDFDPDIYDRAGSAVSYNRLQNSGTQIRPSPDFYCYVYSTSSDDNGTISIQGEKNGIQCREELTLNGTTPVKFASYYDFISTLSKRDTAGDLTVTCNSVEILKLFSYESHRKHIRIYLLETETADLEMVAFGEIYPTELIYDSDVADVEDMDNILITYATGDMFRYLNEMGLANQYYAEASALEEQLWKAHNKNERTVRIIPDGGSITPMFQY